MDFWKSVKGVKNGDNLETFPLITSLVSYILVLPNSRACMERLFSTINLNKTKIRNRLFSDTLTGILHSKMNNQNKHCYNFDVLPDMLLKHNSDIHKD